MILSHPLTAEVLGVYRLSRLVAHGSLARLYEGHLLGTRGFEKRVAIKRVHPELAADPAWVSAFCAEARRQASLRHPNLVEVIDFDAAGGELLLAFEYVDGMTAADLITRVAARQRRVEVGVALFIARELLRGLEHVHDAQDELGPLGMLHGMLTPREVLIGSAGQVKLGEFGLHRVAETTGALAPASQRQGYTAPELLQGHPADRRSDVFAAGVVLAELLLTGPLFPETSSLEGRVAMAAADLSRLRSHGWHLSDEVRHVLEGALAVSPRERYPSAAAFRAAVESVLPGNPGPRSGHELAEWLASLGLVELQSEVRHTGAGSAPRELRGSYRPGPARQYRIEGEEGDEGPLTAAALIERIVTGALPDEVSVSRGREPFVPLRSFPELQGLVELSPYRFRDELDPRAAPVAAEPLALAHQLLRIALSKGTGLLRVSAAEAQVRIYFEDGCPAFSASTDPSSLLGRQLVASGVVSQGAIESALASGWRPNEPLGASLVLRGFLSLAALQAALEKQMECRLRQLVALPGASAWFLAGARSGVPSVPARRSGAALLTRVLLCAYPAQVLAKILLPYWHRELRSSPHAGRLARLLELEARHLAWLRPAAQGVSLSALVTEARADRDRITELLGLVFVGIASGLLT